MWYVYLLKSVNYKKSYVGCTDNIERRLAEHNNGKAFYTRRFKPWILLKFWEFNDYGDARRKERYFKSGVGREELRKYFK